ncbi:MAG: two-component regulator propeller domain-containing protein [Verrucomicrobiota bacterium]|jgi:hypothetical protein
MFQRWIVLACILGSLQAAPPPVAGSARPDQVVPDDVFLQERGRQWLVAAPGVESVAIAGGKVVVLSQGALMTPRANTMARAAQGEVGAARLAVVRGAVYAAGPSGLHRLDESTWTRLHDAPVQDVVEFRGQVVFAAGQRLLHLVDGKATTVWTNPAPFAPRRMVVQHENLWVLGDGRLAALDRGRFGGLDVYGFPADQGWEFGRLPSPDTRDIAAVDGALWIATARGMAQLRGMTLHGVTGAEGLPYEDVTCVAGGSDGDVWIGTSRGVIRRTREGEFHYFAGQRWLPDDRVRAVAVDGRSAWVGTAGGLAEIRLDPFTLARKAAWYEQHLERWGQKRLGFTHKLEWDEGLKEYVREVSDNDGGYTGDYLAAQCYRWAVTRDPAARAEATNTFHALRWLVTMTGIPGFPARSVWAKGEQGHKAGHGSGGYAAEWHDTADGLFEWKGDTSSDEVASHFYAVSLFLELVAQGGEVEQARRHLASMASHLIDHQWRLVDLDGQPTRWGRWDPEYLATDEGRFDRGLQAVELLSFMKTAADITGEARFGGAYARLVELGYPGWTLRQRSTHPPEDIAHFEDQLAYWSWWNLLRRETDPDLRALYRRGHERSHEITRIERNPFFQFLYGALTGNDCDPKDAVAHLREWPLDLRVWSFANSHRADLRPPPGLRPHKGGIRAFSPREHQPMRWDAWTMQEDGGTGGRDVAEPGGWLLAYWMGRYHGYISAPRTQVPGLVNVQDGDVPAGGARPYSGPPRPAIP